ncbi:MAG TPA: NrsF family protein [Polyangiaceae bacterium]|jgi:hypothetical protein
MKTELSPDLKAKILEAALSAPSATRHEQQRRAFWYLSGALAVSALVFMFAGGVRVSGRSPLLVLGTALGSGALASAVVSVVLSRGRSMIGRSRVTLVSVALTAPVALLAWKLSYSARFAGALEAWPARPGMRCLALTLAIGALPLFALLMRWKKTDPAHPRAQGLAMGAAVGLSAAALVDLWCPVAHVSHLLLGHVLPIVLLASLGCWLGARLLRSS